MFVTTCLKIRLVFVGPSGSREAEKSTCWTERERKRKRKVINLTFSVDTAIRAQSDLSKAIKSYIQLFLQYHIPLQYAINLFH